MNACRGSFLRVVRLGMAIRLRTAGWGAWVAVGGGLLAAKLQEPSFFRDQGIALTHDAGLFGGTILLLSLSVSGRPNALSVLADLTQAITTSCFVAFLTAGYLAMLDAVLPGRNEPVLAIVVGGRLLLLGAPMIYGLGFRRPTTTWSSCWQRAPAFVAMAALAAAAWRLPLPDLAAASASTLLIQTLACAPPPAQAAGSSRTTSSAGAGP